MADRLEGTGQPRGAFCLKGDGGMSRGKIRDIPKHGDRRRIVRFVWLKDLPIDHPGHSGNYRRQLRWLERCSIQQVYEAGPHTEPFWRDVCWGNG